MTNAFLVESLRSNQASGLLKLANADLAAPAIVLVAMTFEVQGVTLLDRMVKRVHTEPPVDTKCY